MTMELVGSISIFHKFRENSFPYMQEFHLKNHFEILDNARWYSWCVLYKMLEHDS